MSGRRQASAAQACAASAFACFHKYFIQTGRWFAHSLFDSEQDKRHVFGAEDRQIIL